MFVLVIAVIVIAAVVIFSVQNAAPVSVAFLAWKFDASLAVIVFLALVIGIVVAVLFGLAFRVKNAARRRAQKAESQKTRHDISPES
jgi:lipopolysaccharide assembly protein A